MRASILLAQAVAQLRDAGIADPAKDARRLMAHALGIAAGRLTLVLQDDLAQDTISAFHHLISLRAQRVPVSHLMGKRAFFGRDFVVTPDVLDPRPETEVLILEALKQPFTRVLDLGTGSGCILLSLLTENPNAQGTGTDLSQKALSIAAQNADRLQVRDRVLFQQGDWFGALCKGAPDQKFDLIVSNPPYIALSEMSGLARDVAEYEPRLALTDEADGLTCYRQIVAGAGDHLLPGGQLMVEIGPTQGAAVSDLFREAGFAQPRIVTDMDGRDRVVTATRPAK